MESEAARSAWPAARAALRSAPPRPAAAGTRRPSRDARRPPRERERGDGPPPPAAMAETEQQQEGGAASQAQLAAAALRAVEGGGGGELCHCWPGRREVRLRAGGRPPLDLLRAAQARARLDPPPPCRARAAGEGWRWGERAGGGREAGWGEEGGGRRESERGSQILVSAFDFDFSPDFQWKLKNFLTPKLFKISKPTTFVSDTFSFEAPFECYKFKLQFKRELPYTHCFSKIFLNFCIAT